jgi:hypothetical protein
MSAEFDFFGNQQVSKLFDLVLELGMDLHQADKKSGLGRILKKKIF